MILGGLDFIDPDDFRITPRTVTSTRRALSGKLYGLRQEKRDKLTLSFEKMSHAQSGAILSWMYEQSQFGTFLLEFKRASWSDINANTNCFKGTVEFIDTDIPIETGTKFTRAFNLSFYIDTYEII